MATRYVGTEKKNRKGGEGVYPINWDIHPEKSKDEVPPIEPGKELVLLSDAARLRLTLDGIASIFRHGAIFMDEHAPEAITLWAASTHIFQDAATHNPPLLVTAQSEESGKTKVLAMLLATVRLPKGVTDPSPPYLYRSGGSAVKALKPTFLIDEADEGFFDKAQVTGLINASWTPDFATTGRINMDEGKQGKKLEAEEFSFWQPFVFGMNGAPLKPTTRSRCIPIRMRKATRQELLARGTRIGARQVTEDKAALREHAKSLSELLPECGAGLLYADPEVPPAVTSNRQANNWRLLLAIADLAGGDWPSRARQAMVELTQPGLFTYGGDAELVLETAADWLRRRPDAVLVPTLELIKTIEEQGLTYINMPDKAQWIANQLGHYGLTSRQKRFVGKPTRGYLRETVLAAHDALERGEEGEKEKKEKRERGRARVNGAYPVTPRDAVTTKRFQRVSRCNPVTTTRRPRDGRAA